MAVMSVPGHDERDHAFAQQYDLPIVYVIEPKELTRECLSTALLFTQKHSMACIQKGHPRDYKRIKAPGKGTEKKQFRLRDWGVSRQRYCCPIQSL